MSERKKKAHLSVGDVPEHAMNEVLALRATGLDRLAFREFDKLGECDGGQRLFPFPLCLVFQPQLNGSCGRCDDDPRKNLHTVGIDNVQRVLK